MTSFYKFVDISLNIYSFEKWVNDIPKIVAENAVFVVNINYRNKLFLKKIFSVGPLTVNLIINVPYIHMKIL